MDMGFYLEVMKIFEDKIEVVVAPIQNVLVAIELFNIKLLIMVCREISLQ